MAKVLVLYYSMYGHVETMANAVADGARAVAGTHVDVKRVPETMPALWAAEVRPRPWGRRRASSVPEWWW